MVVHIATFSLAITLPRILDRKPILDEVVTVDLVSLPDLGGPSQQISSPEPEQPQPIIKPEAAVKIPVEQKVAPPPAKKVKQVSLKPLKRKVRKTDPKKLAEEQAKKKREQERLKAIAEAKREEEMARQAAEEARAALATMLRSQGSQKTAGSSRRSSGGRQVTNVAEKIFYASIYDKVKQFWVLPEMRQWNSSLETRVVATILKDGSLARTQIEKRSGDPYFDQYAMKALHKAAPLPPIPKIMRKNSIEIGFVFKPGELSTM